MSILPRTVLVAATLFASASAITASETNRPTRSMASPTAVQAPRPAAHIIVIGPGRDGLGDIHGARGLDPHARELREVAIAAAIGNPEKLEISVRQLRKFGVTREAIEEVIAQADLHTGSLSPPALQFTRQKRLDRAESETERAW